MNLIQDILHFYAPKGEVWAFGSRQRWTNKDYSDLDLAIVGHDKQPLSVINRLRESFMDSTLPYRVDVLDYHAVLPSFRKIIDAEHEVIFISNCHPCSKGDREKTRWGDIATLRYGKALEDYQRHNGRYPVYGSNGLIGSTDSYLCAHPGIVVGRKGAYRGIHYSKQPFYVIDTAFYLEAKDAARLDYRWAYYSLKTKDINSMDSGSDIPSTSRADFYCLSVDLPTFNEQKAIAATLSCLDDKIELNSKINANLEAQAQAIFKSWFVDFELWGGAMPDDWRKGTLGDIIELFDSKRVPLSSSQRSKMAKIYPYYGAATLMDHVDDYLFDGIYLLLGEDGTVIDDLGFPTLRSVWGKFCVDNHAHILQGRNGFTVESLYVLLRQTSVSSIVTGAVRPIIDQADLKSLGVLIPSVEVMEQFNALIDPLFAKIRTNHGENLILANTRDVLLPKLMSGNLPVADLAGAK
jgi:type I restriction enzyme S subunit